MYTPITHPLTFGEPGSVGMYGIFTHVWLIFMVNPYNPIVGMGLRPSMLFDREGPGFLGNVGKYTVPYTEHLGLTTVLNDFTS